MLKNWSAKNKYVHATDSYFDIAALDKKINTPDKTNAMLAAGYNLKLRDDDPDYPALIIGNYMLGGGFLNSRLATRIRQKDGLSYGVGSFLSADPIDQTGSFGSYAIYNPTNSDKLMTAYKEEVAKMLTDGFTDAELKDAITGYIQDQSVNRSRDGYLVSVLSSNLFLKRTMKWKETQESKISALTVDQVNAAMRKWILPEKITYIQAGDFEKKSN
jgi:zinc protease